MHVFTFFLFYFERYIYSSNCASHRERDERERYLNKDTRALGNLKFMSVRCANKGFASQI